MTIEDDIDTKGFPYVYGLPQHFYLCTKVPENMEQAIMMLKELHSVREDISLQLEEKTSEVRLFQIERRQFNEVAYLGWRVSAIKKKRLTIGTIKLLQKWVEIQNLENNYKHPNKQDVSQIHSKLKSLEERFLTEIKVRKGLIPRKKEDDSNILFFVLKTLVILLLDVNNKEEQLNKIRKELKRLIPYIEGKPKWGDSLLFTDKLTIKDNEE
jgi:hypothetical protein